MCLAAFIVLLLNNMYGQLKSEFLLMELKKTTFQNTQLLILNITHLFIAHNSRTVKRRIFKLGTRVNHATCHV